MFAHQLDVSCKKQLFSTLSKHMLTHLDPGSDGLDDAILALSTEFLKREHLGSTAIGRGIALPHIVSQKTATPICCIATSKRPINFEASDARGVDLFGVLLLPERDTHTAPAYLEHLRQILTQRGLRSRLRTVSTSEEFEALFASNTAGLNILETETAA